MRRIALYFAVAVLLVAADAWALRLPRWVGASICGLGLGLAGPPTALLQPTFAPEPVYAAGTLAEQLAAMKAAQDALDAQDIEWTPLEGGVLLREYRTGRVGAPAIGPGSEVTAEVVVRMKTFRTQKDPGGVRYYSTKIDTPDGQLSWTVGDGQLLPELERGIGGMTKGGLRRIEIPSATVFKARKNKQLPLPSANDEEGLRRFERLFKTDATLIFEVLVKEVRNAAALE